MIDLQRLNWLINDRFWRKRWKLSARIFMDDSSLSARMRGATAWKADELLTLFKTLHLSKEEAESVIFPEAYQKEMGWKQ